MISKDKVVGKTFVSGPLAMTDIHNGGTIFGIIYYQYLAFVSETEVKMYNKVTFNRGMKDWQESKESEIWTGSYKGDADNKQLRCELNYQTFTKRLYVDYIDEDTLLCVEHWMDDLEGKSKVFTKL